MTYRQRPSSVQTIGRRQAIQMLDALLAEQANAQKLRMKWQQLFDEDPAMFFEAVVVPLIPASMKEDSTGEANEAASTAERIRAAQLELDELTNPIHGSTPHSSSLEGGVAAGQIHPDARSSSDPSVGDPAR